MNKIFRVLAVLLGILLVIGLKVVLGASDQTCVFHADAYQGLALPQLTQELTKTGLVGRMHGAAPASEQFVLSVRDPQDFFSHREFSLLPANPAVQKTLRRLHRHDQVCIQGNIKDNPSPQKHLRVTAIAVQDPWKTSGNYPEYQHEAKFPAELEHQSSFVGKVHAIGAEGKILVVEYKDGVLPIYVETPALTKTLYRGDIIRLGYRIQKRPQQPTHLKLDPEAKPPILVLDAIATWHNQTKTLTGKLVKFPQSPQIKFDVYALEVETQGIKRTFTLVNFDNPELFQQIRAKLAEIWDKHENTAKVGRNLLINPSVVLEAKGRINIVSTEQANPQILLDSLKSLRLLTEA